MVRHEIRNKLIMTALAVALVTIAITGFLDNKSEVYTDAAFNRALITFGIARGINGVISVAQGTEVAVHPAGFGVNFAPGQILDPINDIIEQFSWVMLASTASLGIQKIFLNMSSSWISSAVLALLMVISVLVLWWPTLISSGPRSFVNKVLLVMVFIRFSVPMAAIGSELLYEVFLAQQYTESTQKLEQTKDAISSLSQETHTEIKDNVEQGMLDKAKKWLSSATEAIDMQARFQRYTEAAAEATRHTINLIVVFIIQTVIFPLLFLWIVYRFLKELGAKLV
ncbi:MAG: hypothetical protein AMJ53_17405 [Gammaproteobacteria bacterium SG8_11]|nr:MAG: hypothetical protein AMJ53_17405 [Gammaproteobacteria bacterium SG8_11]